MREHMETVVPTHNCERRHTVERQVSTFLRPVVLWQPSRIHKTTQGVFHAGGCRTYLANVSKDTMGPGGGCVGPDGIARKYPQLVEGMQRDVIPVVRPEGQHELGRRH